jgi:hypothetical protein
MKVSEITENVVKFPSKKRHAQVQKDRGMTYDEITDRWYPTPPEVTEQEYVIVDEFGKGYAFAKNWDDAVRKRAEQQLKHGVELEIAPWG